MLNRSGYAREQWNAALPYLHSLSERGAGIRFVDTPVDIVESLERDNLNGG